MTIQIGTILSSLHNDQEYFSHDYKGKKHRENAALIGHFTQLAQSLRQVHQSNIEMMPFSSFSSALSLTESSIDIEEPLVQVIDALSESGLESSNLILGIDFTKSNEWTGNQSFNRQSLHAIGNIPNPYEQAISIVGRVLSPFDEHNLIPCFGFGDATTRDHSVFSFFPEYRPCHGFEEALAQYRELVPHLELAGPTSFAPIIQAAMDIVERTGGHYHVLVIIATGQLTRSRDTPTGCFSPQEQKTIDAIFTASYFPLSIVLVGVGNGPWDAMQNFCDNVPSRVFDNFQFVNFTSTMSENMTMPEKEAAFARAALTKIPLQYKAAKDLQLFGHYVGNDPQIQPLPPPLPEFQYDTAMNAYPHSTSFQVQPSQGTPHEGSFQEATSFPFQQSQGTPIQEEGSFEMWEQVIASLSEFGLESSNLILGIDFTKSNEWTGKHSFNKQSLHAIGNIPNPYEQAISIVGQALSPFDEDNLIPCFGFGDATTHDHSVFSFFPDFQPCLGFEETLVQYRKIVPHLELAGPTSFAPIIEAAMGIVERSGGQYHVLVIIADGQVTRSSDTPTGCFSPQEQKTIDSIVAASYFPLSIVLVGVGDGPWDAMQNFCDNVPSRVFDNFQFVDFTDVMSKNMTTPEKEAEFALVALRAIPVQYKAIKDLGLLGCCIGNAPEIQPLPPPLPGIQYDTARNAYPQSTSFQFQPSQDTPHGGSFQEASSFPSQQSQGTPHEQSQGTPDVPSIEEEGSIERREQVCPICLTNPKDMAFNCGHTTCKDCSPQLSTCPICRTPISTRLRLY